MLSRTLYINVEVEIAIVKVLEKYPKCRVTISKEILDTLELKGREKVKVSVNVGNRGIYICSRFLDFWVS